MKTEAIVTGEPTMGEMIAWLRELSNWMKADALTGDGVSIADLNMAIAIIRTLEELDGQGKKPLE